MSEEFIAFDRAYPQDYSLQVEVGKATSPEGVTRVKVDGTGTIEAEQYIPPADLSARKSELQQKSEVQQSDGKVAGRISPDEVSRLMEQASLAPWSSRFPQRLGIPGEAIVVISFQGARGKGASVKMWLRDAEKDAAVGPILEQLRGHLKELAGDKIYL
jgi:hypothetical protein